MREIGSLEAKNSLGALLDAVERGEEITITRRGRAVARLVPAEPGNQKMRAREAVERMKRLRQGVTLGGAATLKELVNEGRR